ncbi:MAG TPA: glycerophosphodiester phosphodiesterase family protein [Tepidisphaeraceae bacterium]|nr:glycerophosphodiester phosphodiesterase family protein [Tepidisphaeraceae bacterium]
MREALIIAHRGESYLAPENTLAAFELAWELGDEAIELDVRPCGDGRVVVCHDENTLRITGQKFDHLIAETSFDELVKLDIGSWKGKEFANQRFVLLENVLRQMPTGRIVFIEIKSEGDKCVEAVVEIMKQSGRAAGEMRMISFHERSIAAFRRMWAEGPEAFWLSGFSKDEKTGVWRPGVEEIIETARRCGANGVDVANCPMVDAAFVKRVHDAGLSCYVWTVDDPATAAQYIRDGVDGITTNRAHWLSQQLFSGACGE